MLPNHSFYILNFVVMLEYSLLIMWQFQVTARDSAMNIHVSTLHQAALTSRLPCNPEQSSLYYKQGFPFNNSSSVECTLPGFLSSFSLPHAPFRMFSFSIPPGSTHIIEWNTQITEPYGWAHSVLLSKNHAPKMFFYKGTSNFLCCCCCC